MNRLQNQGSKQPFVLIVDDNPAIRNVVSWSLQCGGFQPVEAASGLSAITWMEQAVKEQLHAAVILLDLAMPDMDGRAFLEWLHLTWASRYPIPVVIIVSASHLDEKALLPSPAIKQIVTKPFHVRDLLEIIRKWCG